MKRATPQHYKVGRLMRELEIPRYSAVGILESLWHFAAQYAPRGNIGRCTDEEIADAIGWLGEAGTLVDALVTCGWLDRDKEHRLLVHDWHDHADYAVRKYLKAHKLEFASPGCAPERNGLRPRAQRVALRAGNGNGSYSYEG